MQQRLIDHKTLLTMDLNLGSHLFVETLIQIQRLAASLQRVDSPAQWNQSRLIVCFKSMDWLTGFRLEDLYPLQLRQPGKSLTTLPFPRSIASISVIGSTTMPQSSLKASKIETWWAKWSNRSSHNSSHSRTDFRLRVTRIIHQCRIWAVIHLLVLSTT